MFCNNCGKKGHIFKICNNPIMSCGIILINKPTLPINETYKILMVRRKDSMTFTEFLRGKYEVDDEYYIKNLLSNMTQEEHKKIQTKSFEELWNEHWGDDNKTKDYEISKEKFLQLNLNTLLKDISYFEESEWGFPKGRRCYKEIDLECSIREFSEETNISRDSYTICSNLILKETFKGTNDKLYQHLYYIALLNEEIDLTKTFSESQKKEISAIEWKSIEECHQLKRPHFTQREELLHSVERIVKTFNTHVLL
jgi:8-oxo-dGTP pyrophosphatase MutT (NUDIX family)